MRLIRTQGSRAARGLRSYKYRSACRARPGKFLAAKILADLPRAKSERLFARDRFWHERLPQSRLYVSAAARTLAQLIMTRSQTRARSEDASAAARQARQRQRRDTRWHQASPRSRPPRPSTPLCQYRRRRPHRLTNPGAARRSTLAGRPAVPSVLSRAGALFGLGSARLGSPGSPVPAFAVPKPKAPSAPSLLSTPQQMMPPPRHRPPPKYWRAAERRACRPTARSCASTSRAPTRRRRARRRPLRSRRSSPSSCRASPPPPRACGRSRCAATASSSRSRPRTATRASRNRAPPSAAPR